MSALLRRSPFFFIKFSLLRRCAPRTDNTDRVLAFGVNHDQQSMVDGNANRQEPRLENGVVDVGKSCGQRIAEDRRGLAETDGMLTLVRCIFARIPLKL